MTTKIYESDYLVIGSGIAGLSFAIKASQNGTVNIVTKKRNFDSNTNYAQGGIATVTSKEDSFNNHITDTLKAGSNFSNVESVEILVENGPKRIKELIEWGTKFSYNKNNSLSLGKEGGHSFNRIVHAKDLTGQEIERALLKKIEKNPNITLFENYTAIDLLTEHQLSDKLNTKKVTCFGAYILKNSTDTVYTFKAKTTLLASGGAGQVYQHTSNPKVATGDGIAMAYRAGALITDIEFIQFHPTTLFNPNEKDRSFLISEAVRGEGAILLNSKGEKFMKNIHPLKDLAPRDVVARSIDKELKRLGDKHVFLDISFKSKKFLKNRFPNIYNHCLKNGIDISTTPIPVVPAAHYLCGGIITNLNGKSSINNLYVAGESANTGVHGANRLASNSLLEALVFSHRAFENSKKTIQNNSLNDIPDFPYWNKEGTLKLEELIMVKHSINEIKNLMWDYVGIVRSNQRLKFAYNRILLLADEILDFYKTSIISTEILEVRNLATIAKLIIKGAKTRKDSIGLHYNIDYINSNIEPLHIIQQSSKNSILLSQKDLKSKLKEF